MDRICFLQLKAFGDLVIANSAASRVAVADRSRLTLAIGQHLRPLCDAIRPAIEVIHVATSEAGVPSIFDVKRHGIRAAVRSAWQVRGAVARAPINGSARLLFDRFGWRERFIAGHRSTAVMSADTPNIYLGYERLLEGAGFVLSPVAKRDAVTRQHLGIFPGSRITTKNLPVPLVAEVMSDAERRRIRATLFLLDGERPDLEASGLPHVVVPRQFTALRNALGATDAVVSADSLPGHLAESLGIDVFVLTPRPNEFWMPRSVVADGHWCLFDDPARSQRLGAFLAS
jgi:ADP-heptose:LPS heptosyltransferase